jgi:hypothetical protein
MPWKEWPVSEQRICLVQRVLLLGRPLAAVAREFGVSRKTACKWIARPLPRRPVGAAGRSLAAAAPLASPDRRVGRGGRPGRARGAPLGAAQDPPRAARTVATILARRGCVGTALPPGGANGPAAAPPQPFERGRPNELWQVDHKGPVEVARVNA